MISAPICKAQMGFLPSITSSLSLDSPFRKDPGLMGSAEFFFFMNPVAWLLTKCPSHILQRAQVVSKEEVLLSALWRDSQGILEFHMACRRGVLGCQLCPLQNGKWYSPKDWTSQALMLKSCVVTRSGECIVSKPTFPCLLNHLQVNLQFY